MKTMKELANETVTGTSGVSTVQGKIWLKDIIEAAKKRMFFEQFATVIEVPKGNKDVAQPIFTTNQNMNDSKTEGESRTMTEITNMNTVVFTPASHNFGVRISDEVMLTSTVNMIDHAKDQIAYDMANDIDTAIATAIAASSSPAASLYGGDATSTATLEAGDVFSLDLLIKARKNLIAKFWMPEPDRPFVLFVDANAEQALYLDKSGLFIDASKYGSNDIVLNGEIGKVLGVRIVATENVPAATTWGSGSNLSGHTLFMVKAKVSYGIAYGLRPRLDTERQKNEAAEDIYLDTRYQSKVLNENGIVLIYVLDA